MQNETSAGIVVYRYDQNNTPLYLILHYLSGHWDFAKGKLEHTETSLQAAERELYEETTLHAKINPTFQESLSYIFRNRKGILIKKEVTFFMGECQGSSDVKLSREHTEFRWLPFAESMQLLTYENARHVLNQAHKKLTGSNHAHKNSE